MKRLFHYMLTISIVMASTFLVVACKDLDVVGYKVYLNDELVDNQKFIIYQGTNINDIKIKVVISLEDDTQQIIERTQNDGEDGGYYLDLKEFDSNILGTYTIQVGYSSFDATNIEIQVVENTLQSINLKELPTNMSYVAFQNLDASGMVIEGVYASGATEIIASKDIAISYENGNDSLRVGDTKAFLSYHGKSLELTGISVNKANPLYETPTDLSIIYDSENNLSMIDLPENFEFEQPITSKIGDVGNHQFFVKYVPVDSQNYNIVEHIAVEISVEQASPIVSTWPIIDTTMNKYYVGQCLDDVILPQAISSLVGTTTWKNKSTLLVAGKNTCTVIFTPNNSNFSSIETDIEFNAEQLKIVIPNNINVTATRGNNTVCLNSGDNIIFGENLIVSSVNETGYHSVELTINGADFISGTNYQVNGPIDIDYVTAKDDLISIEETRSSHVSKNYTHGDLFDITNLELLAKINNGSTVSHNDILPSLNISYQNGDYIKYGDTKVVLSYTYTNPNTQVNLTTTKTLDINIVVEKCSVVMLELPLINDLVFVNSVLSTIELVGGQCSTEGTFVWVNPSDKVANTLDDAKYIKFVPSDNGYEEFQVQVDLAIVGVLVSNFQELSEAISSVAENQFVCIADNISTLGNLIVTKSVKFLVASDKVLKISDGDEIRINNECILELTSGNITLERDAVNAQILGALKICADAEVVVKKTVLDSTYSYRVFGHNNALWNIESGNIILKSTELNIFGNVLLKNVYAIENPLKEVENSYILLGGDEGLATNLTLHSGKLTIGDNTRLEISKKSKEGLTCALGACLKLESGTELSVEGQIINEATIINQGDFKVEGSITNYSMINNENKFTVLGSFENYGTVCINQSIVVEGEFLSYQNSSMSGSGLIEVTSNGNLSTENASISCGLKVYGTYTKFVAGQLATLIGLTDDAILKVGDKSYISIQQTENGDVYALFGSIQVSGGKEFIVAGQVAAIGLGAKLIISEDTSFSIAGTMKCMYGTVIEIQRNATLVVSGDGRIADLDNNITIEPTSENGIYFVYFNDESGCFDTFQTLTISTEIIADISASLEYIKNNFLDLPIGANVNDKNQIYYANDDEIYVTIAQGVELNTASVNLNGCKYNRSPIEWIVADSCKIIRDAFRITEDGVLQVLAILLTTNSKLDGELVVSFDEDNYEGFRISCDTFKDVNLAISASINASGGSIELIEGIPTTFIYNASSGRYPIQFIVEDELNDFIGEGAIVSIKKVHNNVASYEFCVIQPETNNDDIVYYFSNFLFPYSSLSYQSGLPQSALIEFEIFIQGISALKFNINFINIYA